MCKERSEMVEKRRYGRFSITIPLINRAAGRLAKNLFSQTVVFRAEMIITGPCTVVEYVAASELFDPVPENGAVPFYDVKFETDNGNTALVVTKCDREEATPGMSEMWFRRLLRESGK